MPPLSPRARRLLSLLIGSSLIGALLVSAVEPPIPLGPRYVVKLPFPPGTKYLCIQGNKSKPTHLDHINRYAWDFKMDLGTPVCAAAPGTVVEIKQDSLKGGLEAEYGIHANYVVIDHGQSRFTKYYHLLAGSVPVRVGETVQTGQVISHSGNTGQSNIPHLHFCVADQWNAAIPAQFSDFKYRDGVPAGGSQCLSGPLPEVDQPIPPPSLLPRDSFKIRGVILTCDLPARLYQSGQTYRFSGTTDPGSESVELQIINRPNFDPVFRHSVPVNADGTFDFNLVWPEIPPSEPNGNRHYRFFLHVNEPQRRAENLFVASIAILPAVQE